MRKMTMRLGVAALSLGFVSLGTAQADVTFRAASTTAVPGFKLIDSAAGQVYVAPEGLFVGSEVREVTTQRGGAALVLDLGMGLATEVQQAVRGVDQVAAFANGTLIGVGMIRTVAEEGRVLVTGLSTGSGQHIANMLAGTFGEGMPTFSVVADRGSVNPGDVFSVDVFVSNVTDMQVYQVSVQANGATTGGLALVDANIDSSRTDYIFGSGQTIDAIDTNRSRMGSVMMSGPVATVDPLYVGTFSFTASGTDELVYVNVQVGKESFLLSPGSANIPFQVDAPVILNGNTGSRLDSNVRSSRGK